MLGLGEPILMTGLHANERWRRGVCSCDGCTRESRTLGELGGCMWQGERGSVDDSVISGVGVGAVGG